MKQLYIIFLAAITCGYTSTGAQELYPAERDGKWGYVNVKDSLVIPAIYDDAKPFSDGLGSVKKGDRYGFVDASGKT
ncbi:MAG: WG repeat-containing protein, partial [Bacteroidetes bacterium]|nr:WG repeat-containing protein [Bacteroidota bacterium]